MHNDWEVHQVDVKNAYFNTELAEVIYMKQPPGFTLPGSEMQVCHLFKVLYGLKKAGCCWYHQICKVFTKFTYSQCVTEHCVFYKTVDGELIIVVITVDDLTLTSSSGPLLIRCKAELWSKFDIFDLEPIHWLLGVKIKRNCAT